MKKNIIITDLDEAAIAFNAAKSLYSECRKAQRNCLAKCLSENGFAVVDVEGVRGGQGKAVYDSGHTLAEAPVDLSNWRWIEASKGEQSFIISLQAFDEDPNYHNKHVLYDRIGIYFYTKYNGKEVESKMHVTSIDLPLTDKKIKAIIDILNNPEPSEKFIK